MWKVNSYAVTIAKNGSGLTLGSASVSPNYGSYATVTVTPSSGYYISAASCNDSGYSVKTTSGTTPSFGTAASPTYTSATTFRIYNNSSTATGKTCTFTGAVRTFTVTISLAGRGLSRSASSVSVAYGKTNTVTITASGGGYYISAASCTNGYTVSVSTGTSATGARTATIYNNSKVANSTCTFTGAITFATACRDTSNGGVFTWGNVQYLKLADGNCWTKVAQGTTTWANASSLCSGKGSLPSAAQLDALLAAYGGSANSLFGSPYGYYLGSGALYTATNWLYKIWSSTSYDNTHAWYAQINGGTNAAVGYGGPKTDSFAVVCIRSS